MKALRVTAKHLPEANNLCCRDTNRLDGLFPVESQELRHGDRRADRPRRRGDVPADVVVLRPDGEAELALHLDPCDEGDQKLVAADRDGVGTGLKLGGGQERAGDGARGVDDGVEVGVVVVMDMRRDAVEESRVLRVCE